MKMRKKIIFAYLGLILLGSTIPGNSIPPILALTWDKLLHVGEYSIAGFLGYKGYYSELKRPVLIISIFGILFGCLDEIWQSIVPGRFPSQYDVIVDGIGVILGALTGSFICKNPE